MYFTYFVTHRKWEIKNSGKFGNISFQIVVTLRTPFSSPLLPRSHIYFDENGFPVYSIGVVKIISTIAFQLTKQNVYNKYDLRLLQLSKFSAFVTKHGDFVPTYWILELRSVEIVTNPPISLVIRWHRAEGKFYLFE